jgi:hypothetical protein
MALSIELRVTTLFRPRWFGHLRLGPIVHCSAATEQCFLNQVSPIDFLQPT